MELQPRFLTEEMAESAVMLVKNWVMKQEGSFFKPIRSACHIVILVPEMSVPNNYPHYPVRPAVLLQASFGDQKRDWTADFADIARCMALQLWQGRNDGRTDIMPHLLYQGDHPHWGGVKRDGIVVSCCGVEPWFSKMIASMIADMLIAGAYHAWMNSEEQKKN